MDLNRGSRLGRYEVRSPLGRGGMGEVYLARDTQLDRTVALKILPPDVAEDANRMQRFVREAKAASALNHPNILTIYEIGESESAHFIAAEFIDGETLREALRPEPLPLVEALRISIEVADALSAAHEAGIIHRDIKPENIMLRRRDGYVKVLDFGLAKLAESGAHAAAESDAPTKALFNTAPGMVMGTVKYMSPEQARGLAVDARTDIWSLGCVLYEMVSGRQPFEGATTNEVMASILGDKEPAPLARYAREVPAELERITAKSLRKERDERYQTVKDLLLDLKSLKQDLEFEARLERSTQSSRRRALSTDDAQTIIDSADAEVSSRISEPKVESAPRTRADTTARKIFIALAAIAVLASALGATLAIAVFIYKSRLSPAAPPAISSIAILPFANTTNDPETEYLSDGITESLINSLSQLPGLRMIARSSVFRYKGKQLDVQTAGRELGVEALLVGSVTQRGDNLSISVELVKVSDNTHIWGEQYNRKLSDIVALQAELTRDISSKLRARLTGKEAEQVAKSYTDNSEAYRLYLKGLYYNNKLTKEGYQKGLDYFNQAIDKDPTFALAYAGLSRSYQISADWYVSQHEAMPKARAAAEKALAIDETLAAAHLQLAWIDWVYDWNLAGAEQEFKRAIELKPTDADVHSSYGEFLTTLKRFDEAHAEMERAGQLDPLSPVVAAQSGLPFYFARQYDQARDHFQHAVNLDASFWYAQYYLGLTFEQKGAFTESEGALEKARSLGDTPEVTAALGHLSVVSGKREEALKVLRELEETRDGRYVSPYDVAVVYAALGEKEQAFAALQKAAEDRTAWLPMHMNIDPRLDPLRSDPRFTEMLKRMGFTM